MVKVQSKESRLGTGVIILILIFHEQQLVLELAMVAVGALKLVVVLLVFNLIMEEIQLL